jgi:hypothetical protein
MYDRAMTPSCDRVSRVKPPLEKTIVGVLRIIVADGVGNGTNVVLVLLHNNWLEDSGRSYTVAL